MARDFAKSRQGAGGRQNPARAKAATRASQRPPARAATAGWRWYGAGLLSGVFLSFLVYLGTLPAPGDTAEESPAQETAQPPKPRFDFYTMLPQQSIEVEIDPAEVAAPRSAVAPTAELYLLQAGSFRQREDADRRRAELLLLGLEPSIEEASGDNGRWYRVYLGPFDSHSKMSRARSLTAGQGIDTLLLKRGNR